MTYGSQLATLRYGRDDREDQATGSLSAEQASRIESVSQPIAANVWPLATRSV
ncbi:MAG: hypothetical protein Q8K74_00975 [Candidatus Nitrotoga sp.]|nr:hypothetical protein [Candidatus Nitrotoga sp.]MDP1854612.1 hypothetical protein [Candidatus Nitrotoga sp.]